MKIAIHDFAGHAFTLDLARELARRGHQIDYVYFEGWLGSQGHLYLRPDDPPGLRLVGKSIGQPFVKYSFVKRWYQEQEYGLAVRRYLEQERPEVVISGNTPLDPQLAVQTAARACGAKFLYWLQDIQSLAMANYLPQKHPIVGRLVAAWYAHLERKMLKRSDWVVCIADSFARFLERLGISGSRMAVIHNWAPKSEIRPTIKNNAWAVEHGLAGRKVFLYAGALGLKHDPELLVRLARTYAGDVKVAVVVISEGLGADWLQDRKQAEDLDNLIILPFQPFARLAEVLATGDVLISLIDTDAARFSVPSKVLSYMAAGRPILLSVPSSNLAAQIIQDSNSGIVIAPGDADGFLTAAARLMSDEELQLSYAAAARAYAEKNFDVAKVADKFMAMITEG